jgi:hypothetical protein
MSINISIKTYQYQEKILFDINICIYIYNLNQYQTTSFIGESIELDHGDQPASSWPGHKPGIG